MDEREQLREDIKIDPYQLDLECHGQSDMFIGWAEKASDAKADMENARSELSETEAKLKIECRITPENFGLEKATDKAVEDAVKASPKYLKKVKAYNEARARHHWLSEVAVKGADMRKKMLNDLVSLHGQQYFAGPNVPRNLGEAYAERRKQKEEQAKGRMRAVVKKHKKKKKRRRV